jgi:4a-hydroxytetrahydrobiopterin dehydratase
VEREPEQGKTEVMANDQQDSPNPTATSSSPEAPNLATALAGLPGWRHDDNSLLAAFAAPSSAVALALVNAIGQAAESAQHHPDVDWRYDRVFVRMTSHDAGNQVTERDIRLAREVDHLATTLGAAHTPTEIRQPR